MAAIPRGTFDILLDRIVSALRTFSDEQVLEQPGVGFAVVRDSLDPLSAEDFPLVNVYAGDLSSEAAGSSAKTVQAEAFTINCDLFARGLHNHAPEVGDPHYSDEAALRRLYYLAQQVKHGLYRLISADFGYAPGIIARRSWPKINFYLGGQDLPEPSLAAARITFDVTYAWAAEENPAGVPLEEIRFTGNLTPDATPYGAVESLS
jgi:hypothetical protein